MTSPATTSVPRRAPRRSSFAVLYALAWVPLVVAYIGVITLMSGGTLRVLDVTLAALLNTLGPAVLGMGIWWMAGRFPIPSPLSARFVAIHLTGATTFVIGWMAWEYLIQGPLGLAHFTDPSVWQYVVPWQGILGLLLYGVVAAVSYAVRGTMLVHRLEVAAADADRLRAEAELAALRAHLDPHFLFNTLHGVMQLLRDDPAHAERALERLADLLRYVLRLDRARVRAVALEAEWQFVQSYLWLEQLRLGDRLRLEQEVDDDALACEVPPFTLQPLVENAIRHGIGPKRDGGLLRIRARHEGDRIHIDVADDGLGAAVVPSEDTPGLGLPAVFRRLRSHFGEANVRTEVRTAPDAGFAVSLDIPARPLDAPSEPLA